MGRAKKVKDEEKPQKKVVKIKKEEAPSQFDEMNKFIMKNTDVDATSLKEGGQIAYWIDTGSYALNWIIGNDFFKGVPGARIIVISGETGKGKSLLTDVLLGRNVQMGGASYKVAIESAANFEFSSQIVGGEDIAEKIQIIKPKTPVGKEKVQPITIEKIMAILNRALDFQVSKKKDMNPSVLFVIDSVTQLSSDKELENVDKVMSGKEVKKDMTSAPKMRETLRTIEQKLEFGNVTVIGIGQLTANITSGWTPPGTAKTVVNVKGSGFHYASSLTINMISDKEIVDAKSKTPIGIKMRMKTTKNRIKYRGRDCWIYFYFNRGIDPLGGLPELLARYGIVSAFELEEKENKKTGEIEEKRKKLEQSSTGEFKKAPTFAFEKDDGTEVIFTKSTFKKVIEENGGDEFLKLLNTKLNEKYEHILQAEGITEADLLESDDPDDEGEDDE